MPIRHPGLHAHLRRAVLGRWRREETGASRLRPRGTRRLPPTLQTPRPDGGYPTDALRGPGNGERHRSRPWGPGVTPVVQWEGKGLGRFDASQDAVFSALFDRLVGPADKVCVHER